MGDSLISSHMESALDDLPRGIRQVDYVDFRSMFSLFETMLDAIDKDEFDFTSDDFGTFLTSCWDGRRIRITDLFQRQSFTPFLSEFS